MIKRLKYHEIDFEKYDKCIENSVQRNFYAQKIVLDHLCENWELLIYNDYEFVMPIPIKKKMGFSFVVMPLFLQQLGVFGKQNSHSINNKFFIFFQKKYRTINYYYNFHNVFEPSVRLKKNYFIKRNDYVILRKKYFKGRKSTVKSAQKLELRKISLNNDVLRYIRLNNKGLEKNKDLKKFENYLKFLHENKFLKLFAAVKDEEIASLAVIIDCNSEFSSLGIINNKDLKEENGASFVIDAILKENIYEKSFNFMGGNIRGQEVFFKSFGAELQQYPVIENGMKELLTKIFIR